MIYRTIETNDQERLIEQYGIQPLLAKVICSFGYSDKEIASFFCPMKEFEFDEAIFGPIKLALEKIREERQKVFIFGDYDCDGICSSAIMKKILDRLQISSEFYIPDRVKEGYGLNLDRLIQAYDSGCRVLITVDNGVSALEPLKWAREHNMTTIVTDHHIITEKFEYDYLLHPSILPEDYHYLCGAGVVYLLAEYLKVSDDAMKVFAMVATISDVMSLKGANIKIVNEGLYILKNRSVPNISMLIEGFSEGTNEDDIGFKVAPKINAIGRLTPDYNANHMVSYLLLNMNTEMNRIVKGSNWVKEVNAKRQQLSNEQCLLVEGMLDLNDEVNIVYSENLHEGLLGLIASRIANKTNKVTFIFTDGEGYIKGSGRGIKGINLIEILEKFKQNTIHYGGHSLACGITMEKNQLDPFKLFMKEQVANAQLESSEGVIELDSSLLNVRSCKELFSYRPFGQDRRIPLIKTVIKNFYSYSSLKNKNQLKWTCKDISFISFGDNKGYDYYKGKKEIEAVGELKENIFNGRVTYQIVIKEILE